LKEGSQPFPAGLEVEEKLGPSNPFLEEVTPKEAPVDIIMQSIQVPNYSLLKPSYSQVAQENLCYEFVPPDPDPYSTLTSMVYILRSDT
jgi:hypothetical protein